MLLIVPDDGLVITATDPEGNIQTFLGRHDFIIINQLGFSTVSHNSPLFRRDVPEPYSAFVIIHYCRFRHSVHVNKYLGTCGKRNISCARDRQNLWDINIFPAVHTFFNIFSEFKKGLLSAVRADNQRVTGSRNNRLPFRLGNSLGGILQLFLAELLNKNILQHPRENRPAPKDVYMLSGNRTVVPVYRIKDEGRLTSVELLLLVLCHAWTAAYS